MANPKVARKKLRDFLLIETGNSIALKIARSRIKKAGLTCTPSQYVANHPEEMQRITTEILDKQAKEIIDESFWEYLLKQFGVIAFLFVPAIYSLCEYAILLYTQPQVDVVRLSACLVSILFIFALLFGFISAFFKSKE